MNIRQTSKDLWQGIVTRLNAAGTFLPQIFLRLIIFWEFWEAGKMKLDGGAEGNWFASIDSFPFPFDVINTNISWMMATWGEIIGAILILLGLFTRFAAISLIILTVVATTAVHWPENWDTLAQLWQGYSISNNGSGNYKLPLIYVIMLLPLLFSGAGKFSLDHLLAKLTGYSDSDEKISDLAMWGLALMAIGVPLSFLMPTFGPTLAIAGLLAIVVNKMLDPV
ncbi:MAG: DoxX family protein [Proteobacteria bacterium]|nr:DoxX family protein [Pseudomonadota bacterium]